MNTQDMAKRLRKACDEAGSQAAWSQAHDFSRQYVNNVIAGRVPPSKELLDAIGLEKIVTYRPKPINGKTLKC